MFSYLIGQVFIIHRIVHSTQKLKSVPSSMFILCWFLPLLLVLLPLTTNTYGNEDGGYGWCFVSNRKDSPNWSNGFWVFMAFYFWIWAAILFYIGNLKMIDDMSDLIALNSYNLFFS